MNKAKLASSQFGGTDFVSVSFSGTRGLGRIKHERPSNIDLSTLRQNLPVEFLRGVGLAEELIAAKSLMHENASNYLSCFISFSTNDQAFAEKLYRDLQGAGCAAVLMT
jgi:hypothetical protein